MKLNHLLTLFTLILALTTLTHSQINLATCQTPSQDKNFCLECRNHYHLYQGLCFIDILGCDIYVYGNICKKCSNGCILVNNQCCDKHCMSKAYHKLQNSIENQQNQEQAIKKAQIEGYQKSVSVLAKNSIKIGQDYDIVSTKSQYFDNIYRYQVKINIQGKYYIGILDYDILTKQSSLVDLSLQNQPVQPEINLNEENIHSNAIYERGYKYIYMKYGLDLYELSFSRMTALAYTKTTQLKFVFVGPTKAVIMTIVVAEQDTYTLWKEEKTNVEEITEYVSNLKQIQTISKEQNFQSVFHQALTSKSLQLNDVQIVNITAVSKIQYIFIIFIKTLRIRYVIRGIYNPKTKTVDIKKMEEVFPPNLQDIKIPEKPQTVIIEKSSVSSNTEARQAFEYLYKIRPSFRQTQVDTVKIQTGSEIKTVTIMQTKDNKQYRVVILKDQKTNEFQLIDESQVVVQTPKTTIIHAQNDGTTTVTTNNIDYTQTHTKIIVSSLKQNNIDTTTHHISSIQTVEGPKSIEYTVVLGDLAGTTTKQVTIVQSKQTNITTLIDVTNIDTQINYIAPVTQPSISIPSTQFYKPQIKTLVTSIETTSEHNLTITKIKKIDVVNTTLASKYELVVQNQKGEELTISVIQDKSDQTVQILSVKSVQTIVETRQNIQVTNTKKVDNYGVVVEYTNDKTVLTTDQNVNIALNYINSQLTTYQNYEVISSLRKTFIQNEQQTLILSNGVSQVQVTGTIDLKTLRYIHVEHKQIPLTVTYPVVHQNTIPSTIYTTYIKDHKEIKDSETILVEKYKIFKGKVPNTTTIEQYSDIIKTTFTYEIGTKKFIAVVDYNITTKTGKVIQMNPVQENVVAVTVQTKQINGQTITTSNSIKQIQSTNSNTQNVLTTINTQYPLIKKLNISSVTVIESQLSDTFQVSYIDSSTNLTTVITTTSDKTGGKITINDINTKQASTDKIISFTHTQIVQIAKEQYTSTNIQQIVSFVDTSVSVTTVNKITANIAPTFITYHLEVTSNDKSYNVTVIEKDNKKEVVSIRSTSVEEIIRNVDLVSVDQSGNVIKETNNVTQIKQSQTIQLSIKNIIETSSTNLKNYDVKFVQTIDYGTTQQITITFEDTKTQTLIQSVVFYDETTKKTNVISVTPVPTTTFVHTTHPTIPTTIIPAVSIEQTIKTDKGLQTVISNIHTIQTTLATATTVSVEHQTISEQITKYTVILQVEGVKSQAVYVWNQETQIATPVVITTIPSKVDSYYLTTTQTEEGLIIKSNNVTKISEKYTQVTNVLAFASTQQLIVSSQQVKINSITLHPTIESTTYTIDVTEHNQHKTIVFNQDTSSNTIKLIDFNVETIQTVYPREILKVHTDVSTNQKLVQQFITIIKKTKGLQTIKEIVTIEKQTKQNYEKYYLQVITTQNIKYFVTLGGKTGETLSVLDAVKQIQTIASESGVQLQQVDTYGNTIIQITSSTYIKTDTTVQTSIKTVLKQNTHLQSFDVISVKKIDYGTVEEIHFVFESQKDIKQKQVETVVFYNKTSKTTDVVSVATISTEQSVYISEPKVNFIPSFAIASLTQSNKGFETVITNIHTTKTTSTTVSAESQIISQNIVKYTVVLEQKGEKSQVVYIWNEQTKIATPVVTVPIPKVVQSLYVKKETTTQGSTIIQTNDIKYITQSYVDFKNVTNFILTTTGAQIISTSTQVQINIQNNINTYTVTIKEQEKTKEIIVNYDLKTHQTYLVDYKEKPVELKPIQVQYNSVEVKHEEKVEYLNWIKNLHHTEIIAPINILSIKTVKNALYSQAIIEVQTQTSNVFIKTIKTHDLQVPTVVSVTKAPLIHIKQTQSTTYSEKTLYIAQESTSTTTDTVGHIITESTSTSFITNSEVIQSAIKILFTTHIQYSDYTIKYTKTIRYTKAVETILTLQRTSQDITIQVVTVYDQTSKKTKIISIRQLPVTDASIISAPYPVPIISTVTIPQNLISTTIKTDFGLQSVITSNQIKTSSIISAQVQTYDSQISQYSIVFDSSKGKQQIVSVFNITSKDIQPVSISVVPTQIKPTVFTQTKVNNQKIVISNQIELIKSTYSEATTTINTFIQQNPTIKPKQIESFIVTPSSQTTSISIIATNQQSTKYTYHEYITTDSKQTIQVNTHTVPIIDLVKPKPIVSIPVSFDEITSNVQITSQLIKIVNVDTTTTLDTTKITSIQKSQQTNVQIYTVNTLDSKNQQVAVQVIYNPVTQIATVVDVSKIVETSQVTFTETLVQEFTGKSSVVTTNVATIKQAKEFKKISDLIVKNHPTESTLITYPLLETTEKYQRAAVKSIVFSQQSKTIQGTYLIDQRSNTVIELKYNTIDSALVNPTTLPINIQTVIYTTIQSIKSAIKVDIALINTIKSVEKVDFSLANLSPLFIQIKNYTSSATITLVFETPTSNSRILAFFNYATSQAKVVDYTKVAKIIEPSKTIESTNELGQVSVFTTNTKTITTTEQYKTVYSAAIKVVPSIAGVQIKGVETLLKQKGKEYTIITVNNGIINQVVLQTETSTNEVTFISHTQTSVANQIISVIPQPQQPIKIDIQTLQTSKYTQIAKTISTHTQLGKTTIVSGTTTSNDFVQTYNLVVRLQNNTNKVITVTKDITTQEIIINNVQSPQTIQSVQIQTITSQNQFGQVQTITNDYEEITTTEETITTIKKIIRKKPHLVKARPISTKFITYGNTVESTILFRNDLQPSHPVQITSIMNTKTTDVEIVTSRQVTIKKSQTIAPVINIQTIPAPAIKIAAKKSVQINQIISLVQSSTTSKTQIETLSVQDLGTVKKYIAVVTVPTGKQQIIYFYDKQTQKITVVDSHTVAVIKTPTFYTETVNHEGQIVISSSSVQKIIATVPQTTKAINLLVKTYTETFTSTIKSVQSKGTTIKQIKFVTVDTTNQQQIYTVLVDTIKNTVTIIDVAHPISSPKPIPPVTTGGQGGQSGLTPVDGEKGEKVTPAIRKTIEEVIIKNVEIKEKFVHSTVLQVKQTTTSFTNTYIATIKDQNNVIANVTLIQNPGESIKVVNIESHQQKKIIQTDISTKTTTSTVTGQVRITTNDHKVIQSNPVVQQITTNLIKVQPTLIKYQPVSSQTISYGEITQTTLSFTSQETTIQTVTLYNQTSKTVDVVSIKKVQKDTQETVTQPTVSIQTIPGSAIIIATRKMPQIKQIITFVQSATTKTTVIETLTVQDYVTSRKYVAIAVISGGKHQSVYFYEKSTQQLKQISVQVLPSQIAVVNVEQTVNKWGEKVITSNNVEYISSKYTDTVSVVKAVDTLFKQQTTSLTQSIQITQQQQTQNTQEYKLVIHVNNTDQQVTVVNTNGQITVTNVQVISSKVEQIQQQSKVQIKHTVETIDVKSTVATEITQFVHQSKNTQVSSSQIVSINATQNIISTVYDVTVKDNTGKITVLEVLNQTGQNLVLISTNQVQPTSSVITAVTQTVTTKEVNKITGQTITTSTDSTFIQSTENKIFIDQITTTIPSLISIVPSVVQTTVYGNFVEKTFVIEKHEQTIQITTLLNKTSNIVTIVDSKKITPNPSIAILQPVTYVSVIPAPLITATSTQITQIADIVTQIKSTTKKEVVLQSITIEDFGNINKYIATIPTPTNKQQLVYLYDKKQEKLTLIENYTTSLQVENLIYQQSTNQYGQVTVQSNNATQVVTTIPQISSGITYISTKYTSITSDKIDYIKVVEYPQFYQSTIIADSSSPNGITIVLNVDKQTKVVTEVSTYSSTDTQITSVQTTTQVSTKPVVTLHPTDPLINQVIKFIQSSKDIPINQVKTVTYGNTTTTVFGSQIITVEAISTDSKTVLVTVRLTNNKFELLNFQILHVAATSTQAVTAFKVDSLSGTKTTTTNDTTVITSSQITTTLLKELQISNTQVASQTIISSTTVEYPDKVKVITIFTPDTTSNQVTQITSIYDKSTASITIVQTSSTTLQQITTQSTTQRQIYTNTEIQTAINKIISVPATTTFVQQEFPIYVNQNPSSIIVQTMKEVEFISYIYDSTQTSTQVVVMYNKTTGQSTLIESNPIQPNIHPFFYEQKKNIKGESVITSNNLTQVIQRVPKTQILQTYLTKTHQINTTNIKTVQSVISSEHNYYTIVVEQTDGLKQYEFVVNTQKNEVKQVQNIKLPSVNDVIMPHHKPAIKVNPEDVAIKPFITEIIESKENNLNSFSSIVTVTKTQTSNVNKFEIEYVNETNQVNKLIVHDINHKPVVVDERPIIPKFVDSAPIVVSEQIDSVTKTTSTTFVDAKTFSYDAKSADIIQYIAKNIPQTTGYTLQSATKSTYGQIEQYNILYKSVDKAPLQISLANDNNNKNIILLQTKKITEQEQKSVLENSVSTAKTVQVSEIEKENVKVMSKFGFIRNVQEYVEIPLETIDQNQQFLQAIQAVKQSYSVLLKQSVIIKILQQKTMQADIFKVFFKAKDQIYEADIQINPITQQTKLTGFIKIGTKSITKSQVNVYSDLCYGYQVIEDISSDSNLDFLLDHLKKKHETLSDSSLTEAQSIVLENGRINYKLYFKKDGQTVKYIVYYEPEYKRVLQVKGTSFLIGDKFKVLSKEQQITDPYFRKLDTYVRQNNDNLNSAIALHTESKDDGQTIQFRTVYSSAGKTYRSIASINKDNQNVNEIGLNQIIQIPTQNGPVDIAQNQALSVTKLDIHDVGKNLYFTQAHRFIQSKYQQQLDKAQLLGASGKSNLFSYNFKQFYMVDDQIIAVSAEYNPVTQKTTIISEPQIIDIQQGYFPASSDKDKKLSQVRSWLKEKNLDLSSSVLISSESKNILFGTAYKLSFKDLTKYNTYIVYYESSTKSIKILYEKDSTDAQNQQQGESPQTNEPKLKGFARPSTEKPTISSSK